MRSSWPLAQKLGMWYWNVGVILRVWGDGWMLFAARNRVTRVVLRCKTRKHAKYSPYTQQHCYCHIKNNCQCPWKIFHQQLWSLLQQCQNNGKDHILMLDANKDTSSYPSVKFCVDLIVRWRMLLCLVLRFLVLLLWSKVLRRLMECGLLPTQKWSQLPSFLLILA